MCLYELFLFWCEELTLEVCPSILDTLCIVPNVHANLSYKSWDTKDKIYEQL
jgi:hypothetical protein